jgi:hypothetical protein
MHYIHNRTYNTYSSNEVPVTHRYSSNEVLVTHPYDENWQQCGFQTDKYVVSVCIRGHYKTDTGICLSMPNCLN